jgi:hypothetical protein
MGIDPRHPAVQQALERGLFSPATVPLAIEAPPPECSEKKFQAHVARLAESHEWEVFHVFDSRRSKPGFPDLLMIKGSRLLVCELKVGKNTTTADQDKWLALFRTVGAEAFRWYPADWPALVSTLTGTEGGGARE